MVQRHKEVLLKIHNMCIGGNPKSHFGDSTIKKKCFGTARRKLNCSQTSVFTAKTDLISYFFRYKINS